MNQANHFPNRVSVVVSMLGFLIVRKSAVEKMAESIWGVTVWTM
jgi:hypothetical protein